MEDESTIGSKRRSASKKRLPKYQEILIDSYARCLPILDIVQTEIASEMAKYPMNSIQYLLGLLWHDLLLERKSIFLNLMHDEYETVAENQRGIYAVLRFCMEMVSDAYYLTCNPKELKTFLTNEDEIVAEIQEIQKKEISALEKDEEIAAVASKGRLRGPIKNRIIAAFPGKLQDYRMFCMYTHLNMQGLKIYVAPNAVDLLFTKVTSITMDALMVLFILMDAAGIVTEEAEQMFRNTYWLMLECHKRVKNLYYGKNDKTRFISEKQIIEEHTDFCNRKTTKASKSPEPEKQEQTA